MTGGIISGERSCFEKDTRGFGEFFFDQANKFGNKICQIDGLTGKKETFSSLKLRSARLALHLKKLGVVPGDKILSCLNNSLDSIIPHISTLCLGAVISAPDPSQSTREWTHFANMLNPKIVFIDEGNEEKMEKAVASLREKPVIIVVGKSVRFRTFEEMQTPVPNEEAYRPEPIKNCHETAVILFSSGTTGSPKGICFSHFSVINSNRNALHMIRHPEVSLNYATLYWISAVMVFVSTVHCGAARLILPKYDGEQFLAKIEEYKITYTFMLPLHTYGFTNLENPEKYDVSSLHILTIAGTPISPDQMLKTKKIFKHTRVIFAYGSTEAGNFICYNESEGSENDLKSIGRPLYDTEMKVVDPDTGKILGPNQKGELRYKSPYILTGYCNMNSSPYFDEDGFFKSGDLGFYNDNECFYITGRIKEMFKYRTWHVVPTFIESILMEHPAVLEAAVFGLPHEVDGFHPAAFITLRKGKSFDVDDLQRFIDNNVSEWQKLRGGIKVLDSFPKTATSKIQKAGLIELFLKS